MRPRWRLASLTSALAILVVASTLVLLRGSTPVSVDAAVDRYRAEERRGLSPRGSSSLESDAQSELASDPRPSEVTASIAEPAATDGENRSLHSRRPGEGVYVYDTSGWEEVESAGIAGRRRYPDETTVTVRHTACGHRQRWDPLEEHWTEAEICLASRGDLLHSYTTYIEYLNYGERKEFRCHEGTLSRPLPSAPRGMSWKGRCVSSADTADFTGTVLGIEVIEVEGSPIKTIRYETEARISGEDQGLSRTHTWTIPNSGLVVRRRSSNSGESDRSPFGRVRYREEYEIELLSLEPRR